MPDPSHPGFAPRRYSAHLGYLFTELPLENRFAAAARAGFSIVEHSNPYALPAERVRDLCREHGLEFLQMALPAGDASRGEKGLAAVPGREAEFRDGLETALRYADVVGVRYLHAMAGVLPEGRGWADVRSTYTANLRIACEAAARHGITVLVEAIGPGTIARYALDDPAHAVDASTEVGAANLSIILDSFHETGAGRDPVAFVEAHGALIAHVHLADHPGRHEPGSGSIDFGRLFAALNVVGYAGVFGLEYVPARGTLASLDWRERLSDASCAQFRDPPSGLHPGSPVASLRAFIQETDR